MIFEGIGSMPIWLEHEAEPLETRDTGLYGLGHISEDSQTRTPSASPDGLSKHFDYVDFGDHQGRPKRSPTYPFVPSCPPKEHLLKPLGKANDAPSKYQKPSAVPPIPKRLPHNESSLIGPGRIRHSSTFDTTNSASFEATAVWDQKAILSLDGGGIRGYSALLILQELMRVIGTIERNYACGPSRVDGPAESSYHPLTLLSPAPCLAIKSKAKNGGEPALTESSNWLPCHYFDYVAGTSTGGLIGIMLGRLRMNVDDCISEYETLGAKVFGHSRKCHIRSPLFWPRDKYKHKTLESVVRDVVRRRVPKVAEFPGGRNFASDENRCRTVVVAFQQQSKAGAEKPYLFRTYKNLHKSKDAEQRKLDRNPDMAHDIPIWQVARATSAAPTYFKPPIIDGLEYVDGGFGANNPCAEIYEEVRIMNNNSKRCASIILSIGTGKNNESRRVKGTGFQRYLNYLNFAKKWASDSEQTHLAMLKAKNEQKFDYFRLNVEEGLDQMKLDEWRARSALRIKTGERIGTLRSTSTKDRRKDEQKAGAGATSDHRANVPEERNGNLQNGTGIIYLSGNEDIDHAALEASTEEAENTPPQRTAPDAATSAPTAYLEHVVDGVSSNGHSPSTSVSESKPDPVANETKVPKWFQPKNRTLESIRKSTEDYLLRPETIRDIERCAKLLVDGRRGRAKSDPQRWERACFGTWYQCRIPGCPRGEKEYEKRWQLQKHLLDKHKAEFTRAPEGKRNLDRALDSCKIVVH